MVLLVNVINVCYGTILRASHAADPTELFLLFVQCVGIADGDTGKSVLSISFAQLDCTRALSYRSSRASRSGTPVLMHMIVLCFPSCLCYTYIIWAIVFSINPGFH